MAVEENKLGEYISRSILLSNTLFPFFLYERLTLELRLNPVGTPLYGLTGTYGPIGYVFFFC